MGGIISEIRISWRLSACIRQEVAEAAEQKSEEEVSDVVHFYIGDENEADEAADAKENRRKEIATQWKEPEMMEVRLGLPIRRGRKWLRRNNVNVVDELGAACKEDAAENAAPEAENVEKPKADVPKKKKKVRKKKVLTQQIYLIDELD